MNDIDFKGLLITCGVDPSKFTSPVNPIKGLKSNQTIIYDHKAYFQFVNEFGLTVCMGKYWMGGNFEVGTKLVYGFSQDPEFYETLITNLFKAWALGVR